MAKKSNLIMRFNPIPAYSEHLRKLINFDVIADNPQRIVVNSMYGSGRGVSAVRFAGDWLRSI